MLSSSSSDPPEHLPQPQAWDRLAGAYAPRLALRPPERALLRMLRDRWHLVDMLDLGVGTGRTAYTFAALVASYVGIDFAPQMVDVARRVVGSDHRTVLEVGDARDLSQFRGRDFDVVLFSFNGIDNVGHDDRQLILKQIRSVLSPTGIFAFSCHSLDYLPFPGELRLSALRGFRSAYQAVGQARRRSLNNRRIDLPAARAQGWMLIEDDSGLVQYYVTPLEQLRQLAAAGFEVESVLDAEGREVEPANPGKGPHLFYVCRPAQLSG